jgi:molybdopterin converting factor small subunit
MRIRLRFFAMLREKLGDAVERDARAGATVAAVWRAFVDEHPEVAGVRVRFAVDETYVEPSTGSPTATRWRCSRR